MITKIEVNSAVMFDDSTPAIDDLRKFNYFFGANGTGKTTISKVIEDSASHPGCNVLWEDGNTTETQVYNRDFVERNFSPQKALKGVFTLGEQEADTLTKIGEAKASIDALKGDIANLKSTLQGNDGNGGKKKELADLERKYADRFFVQKKRHDNKLSDGMEGYRNSKDRFKEKVLSEATANTSDLKTLVELEAQAAPVFSDALACAVAIDTIQPDKLLALENDPILAKRIIGKDDVDIAAIIKKLGNSDWVRQGRSYYEANDGVCPFCQQKTDEDFAKSLNDYFDDTFERDSASITSLVTNYSTESSRIQQQVQAIIDLHSEFVDDEKLEAEKRLLDSSITVNLQRLAQKKIETSQVFELGSLQNVLNSILSLIAGANEKIAANNNIVINIDSEKSKLTGQIWRFIVEELKTDINDYNTQRQNLSAAINNLQSQLQTKEADKQTKTAQLQELEKQNVSIQPTLDSINNLLASFGFKNFRLSKGSDERTYKVVRENGKDAQITLSEGEKNFVTFLYFYYLLKGSQSETGLTTDRIVVFDDPVSSLDSDVLFIVSSLIRGLIENVRQDKGTVKQVFVLTHNVYFYKELTYSSRRNNDQAMNEESFWLIRKQDTLSSIERQTSNPIKTSYQLLWEEARSEQCNTATTQNTLRRILENYFKLLGGISLDKLYTYFDGDDKIKCKDLCSWVNDGSHSGGILSDEYYSPPDKATVDRYLQVFKAIFDKCGHIAHYNMMMGITPETDQQEEQGNEQAEV
jgi:wobble nucleotide-excising tRNase